MGFLAGCALVTSRNNAADVTSFHHFGPFEIGVVLRSFSLAYVSDSANASMLLRIGAFQAPPESDAAFAAGDSLIRLTPGETDLQFRCGATEVAQFAKMPLMYQIESPKRYISFRVDETGVGALFFVIGLDAIPGFLMNGKTSN